MAASYKIRIILEEESKHKHTDMHTIVIGIRCHDDPSVAEVIHVLLKSECIDQQVELLILRKLLRTLLVAVQRLSTKREHSLSLGVACLGDGSACRVSLGDEDAGLVAELLLGCRKLVLVVVFAVTELLVIDACTLVALLGILQDRRILLALLLRSHDLLLKHRDDLLMHVEIVVKSCLDEVVHETSDGRALLAAACAVRILYL